MVDPANPNDAWLGMIGSSVRLLAECRVLAEAMGLPPGVDPDDEEGEMPSGTAAEPSDWRRYPIEAYVLSRLIWACEASIRTGAAAVFC